jgi:hypothetical protein
MSGFTKWCKFACSYAALRYSYHTHYAKIEETKCNGTFCETSTRDMLLVERAVVVCAGCAIAPSFAPLMIIKDAMMIECNIRGIDHNLHSYTDNNVLGHIYR